MRAEDVKHRMYGIQDGIDYIVDALPFELGDEVAFYHPNMITKGVVITGVVHMIGLMRDGTVKVFIDTPGYTFEFEIEKFLAMLAE